MDYSKSPEYGNAIRVRNNIKTMLDKGASPEEVDSYVSAEGLTPDAIKEAGRVESVRAPLAGIPGGEDAPTPPPYKPAGEPGLLDRIGSDLSARKEQANQVIGRGLTMQETLPETGLQLAGTAAGAIGDVGIEGIKSIIPSSVSDMAKSAAGNVAGAIDDTSAGKWIGDKLLSGKEFVDNHPRLARNVGAALNIASIIPAGRATRAASDATGGVLTKVGDAVINSADSRAAANKAAFVQDLILPRETPSVRADQFSRSTEQGLLRTRVLEPTAQEKAIAETVSKLPVSSNKSLLANYNIIYAANSKEAANLMAKLKKSDVSINPNESSAALDATLDKLKKNLFITGDAETTAQRTIDLAKEKIAANEQTASGLLQARKDFDNAVKSQKGSGIFDPERDSAASIAVQNVRQTINDLIESKVPDAGFKDSLRKQSNLYRAMDNLETKGAYEPSNILKRGVDKLTDLIPVKGAIGKTAALVGGAAGAVAAPYLVGGAAAAYGAGKLLKSPLTQKGLGVVIKGAGKTLKGAGSVLNPK